MSTRAWVKQFQSYSVPVCVFALVAVVVLLVPPLVLGELSGRTYAITAAVLILAVTSVFPYAVIVAVMTLPLLYAGVGSYAAPEVIPAESGDISTTAVLRHVVAAVSYVLGAAIVGGVVVAGAFVSLQLWRYADPVDALDQRTVLGTVVLGTLLALSPVVALWLFESVRI
ncbi:MAG: hypothetical protein ABEH86_00640 [Haloarcula sp.]